MEASKYYTAVFLDINNLSFDKVWHDGLLYEIKDSFSSDPYAVIKSYFI
jgi:hypothetical protein